MNIELDNIYKYHYMPLDSENDNTLYSKELKEISKLEPYCKVISYEGNIHDDEVYLVDFDIEQNEGKALPYSGEYLVTSVELKELDDEKLKTKNIIKEAIETADEKEKENILNVFVAMDNDGITLDFPSDAEMDDDTYSLSDYVVDTEIYNEVNEKIKAKVYAIFSYEPELVINDYYNPYIDCADFVLVVKYDTEVYNENTAKNKILDLINPKNVNVEIYNEKDFTYFTDNIISKEFGTYGNEVEAKYSYDIEFYVKEVLFSESEYESKYSDVDTSIVSTKEKTSESVSFNNEQLSEYPSLLVAIESEKDAEVTYKTLIEKEKTSETPNTEIIELLEKILSDELEHVALLSALTAKLNSKYVGSENQTDFEETIDEIKVK